MKTIAMTVRRRWIRKVRGENSSTMGYDSNPNQISLARFNALMQEVLEHSRIKLEVSSS